MQAKDYNYGYIDLEGNVRKIWRSDKTATPNDEWQGAGTAPFADAADFDAYLKDLALIRQQEIEEQR